MKRRWLIVPLAGLLAGCPVGPDYRKPHIPVPRQWAEGKDLPVKAPPAAWWKTFHDPVLDRLIADAAHANLDVQQAALRIREARNQRTVAIAQGLPNINANTTLSRRYNNFLGGGGSGGNTVTTGGGIGFPIGGGSQYFDIIQGGFDVQWEIDLFGGIRRNIEAAQDSIEAENENRRDVLVSLQGEVARLYIDMRANQQQMAITRENLRTQEDTLGLTLARYEAGLASALEVAQQEAQAVTTRSQLPTYEIAVKQSAHALAVLLAKPPGALLALTEGEATVPAAESGVAADLPSELLRRRPDIRRAERQVAAATARIGVATAELYPRLNLSSFAGFQNQTIGGLTPVGKAWNVASSLSLPIFNWGRIRANIDSREAETQQSLLTYEKTILTALKEVEDALVAYRREQDRRAALAQAVEASRLAVKLADERFQKGLSDFLNVLEAQRAVYLAESNLVQSQARTATALVALYKALGGGWEAREPPPEKAAG